MTTNTDLFTPLQMGDLQLPNRIVLAPLTRNRAGEGNVPQSMNAEYYRQRASGGLLISEATQISPQGVGYPATPYMQRVAIFFCSSGMSAESRIPLCNRRAPCLWHRQPYSLPERP